MNKGKYLLNRKQTHATYILRRRRRELNKRLELSEGSESSLYFDMKEAEAISEILNVIRELCEEEKKEAVNAEV